MKRNALAGIFALLAGGVTLLLLASIFYSCRMGGHPHDMGNSPDGSSHGSSHSSSAVSPAPQVVMTDQTPAGRLDGIASSAERL